MQDEVEANAQTLELEKTTMLEEGYCHYSLRPLLSAVTYSNSRAKGLFQIVQNVRNFSLRQCFQSLGNAESWKFHILLCL
jgi:hypothetical protein